MKKGIKGANYKFKNGIQTNRMYNYKSEDKPSLSQILNKVHDESLTLIDKMSDENKQKFISKIQSNLENIQKNRYKDIVSLRDGVTEIDKKSILEKKLQNDFTLGKFVPLTTTCILCNQKFVLNVARLVATNW